MPDYQYTARNDLGQMVQGHLVAAGEDNLAERLENQGLVLVSAQPIHAEQGSGSLFERVNRKDLISFSVHLSTVLSAGVPLLTGLEDLVNQTEKVRFRRIIEDIMMAVESGLSLSEALERHERVFGELYVNMVRAGEATGEVEKILNDLISFLEWQEDLGAQIKEALIYPIILIIFVAGLVFLLFSFVLPKFLEIFQRNNVPLPPFTQLILDVSHFFSEWWYAVTAAVLVPLVLMQLLKGDPRGRLLLDYLKLRIPVFGELVRKFSLSRFSHQFGALLSAGIDIPQSLEISGRLVGNEVLAAVLRRTLVRVREGEPISRTLSASGEFPPLVVRMMSIGETTGALELTMGKVNQYYDREIPATIKRFFAILGPLLIIVLGLIVVTVAASMFLPMYQMTQVIHTAR
jgi:type IV pilus assembly protein PilC